MYVAQLIAVLVNDTQQMLSNMFAEKWHKRIKTGLISTLLLQFVCVLMNTIKTKAAEN